MDFAQRLERAWYRRPIRLLWLLWPLEILYRTVVALRRIRLQRRAKPQQTTVIVVGNITVGGTGKTPLVIALVRWLQAEGYKPGVISRGYGGQAPYYPFVVTASGRPEQTGDEPLLIASSADCPVVIGPDRVAALAEIERRFGCDVVISDDGLQHYALQRHIEIAVVDGVRGFGNGHCLPMGPLREPARRVDEVDLLVINGESALSWRRPYSEMQLEPAKPVNLLSGKSRDIAEFEGRVHAVAGIGNPRRFFTTLLELGLSPIAHPFPDHHRFIEEDLRFEGDFPLVMTEKDAVKCRAFATDNMWFLPVQAALPASFYTSLKRKLKNLSEE